MNTTRDHIVELDGLRGIAVLLVMWGHLEIQPALPVAPHGAGWFGVDLFFVLSGFLITRILLHNRVRGIGFRHFYRRRFLRIFPAFYLMLAAVTLWIGTDGLLWSATYTINFSGLHIPPLYHVWSLCVEEHFYLVWPLVVLVLPAALSRRFAIYGVCIVIVGAIGFEAWATQNQWAWNYGHAMYRWTPFRIGTPLLGACIAYFESTVRGRRMGLYLGFVAVGAAVVASDAIRVFGESFGAGGESASAIVWNALMATAVLLGVLSGQFQSARLTLTAPWLGGVGRISYGLYLYHLPIFCAFNIAGHGPGVSTVVVVAATAVTFAVAWLSFTYIEQPLMQWGRRREADQRSAAASGVANAT